MVGVKFTYDCSQNYDGKSYDTFMMIFSAANFFVSAINFSIRLIYVTIVVTSITVIVMTGMFGSSIYLNSFFSTDYVSFTCSRTGDCLRDGYTDCIGCCQYLLDDKAVPRS